MQILEEEDKDQNGSISFEEFCSSMTQVLKQRKTRLEE